MYVTLRRVEMEIRSCTECPFRRRALVPDLFEAGRTMETAMGQYCGQTQELLNTLDNDFGEKCPLPKVLRNQLTPWEKP